MAPDDDYLAGFRHLHGEVDHLFADLMGVRGASAAARALTDVYLTDDPPTLTVTVDVAGLDAHSLEVELDGDVLSVRGVRRRPDAAGRRVYQHAEIEWGPFERRLRLATPVDPAAATVTYVQGLLQIALPLAARAVVTRVLLGVRIP
jgi:HSP20 family protein